MKKWLLLLVIFFSTQSYSFAVPPIEFLTQISKSIVIHKDIETVYEHVKDTMNDDTWRTEVNDMSADGPFRLGTTYTEDAHIGLNRNFITKTVLMGYFKNKMAYYVTPLKAKYFLSSLRQVKKIDEETTEFTYTVKFDSRMSEETLGINLSPRILEISYGIIMKQYLRNLKRYLE